MFLANSIPDEQLCW